MVDPLLAERRVVACIGSGGVGKTTLSAALGLRAAVAGRRVLVLTIDPARRLANALGLPLLGNVPTRIAPELLQAAQLSPRGELHAMALDLRQAWDSVVTRHAPTPEKREAILRNRLYRTLSTRMAGSLEYMAMEKLHELERSGEWDLVVLDTPPTAHALDFLHAPDRLLDLLSNDVTQWLSGEPGGLRRTGLSLVGLGSSYILKGLAKFTGGELLQGLAEFFTAFQGMYEGFAARAAATRALLSGPDCAFVLVTSPRRTNVDEGLFLADALRREGISIAAAVVNRVQTDPRIGHPDAATDATGLALALAYARVPTERPHLETRLAETVADLSAQSRRDTAEVTRLMHGSRGAFPIFTAQRMARDVHDVASLWQVATALKAANGSD